MKRRKKS